MKSVRNCRKCWLGWRTKAQLSWRMARCSANKTYTANTGTCNIKAWSTGRLPQVVLKVGMNMTSFGSYTLKPSYLISHLIFFADTLALLLTDVLVFLQEKDQRFIFAAVVSCGTEKESACFIFRCLFRVSVWVFICCFRTKSLLWSLCRSS